MTNIYYSPEAFGVEAIGDINWRQPCYDFDQTAVWRDPRTGEFLWADDSGCSCPSPFESFDLSNVSRGGFDALAEHLRKHLDEDDFDHWYGANESDHESARAAVVELLARARAMSA